MVAKNGGKGSSGKSTNGRKGQTSASATRTNELSRLKTKKKNGGPGRTRSRFRIPDDELDRQIIRQTILSPYEAAILEEVLALGGFFNAHAHIDRADTLTAIYLAHINMTPLDASIASLKEKQNMTGNVHRGRAYTEEDLRVRISRLLDRLIAHNTTRLSTCVDVCPGIPEGGLLAWRVLRELAVEFADRIVLKLGPSPIFGMKEGTSRWEAYLEAAKTADFLTGLPEKDDYDRWKPGSRDGKIGFEQHAARLIRLGAQLDKELHLHLDQRDDPNERGSERIIQVIDMLEHTETDWVSQPGEPKVWFIHVISPSAYPEDQFKRLVENFQRLNIGVIVCPTAAISMRRLRPISAPMHNAIARIPELIKARIPIRLGSDNICDMLVPGGTGDMLSEVVSATNDVRYYAPHVWAKLATGTPLNEVDVASVGKALYQDLRSFTAIDDQWQPAVQ